MEQPQYSALAEIYAYLMRKIDYKDWSDYLISLFRNFGSTDDRILELGGGIGTIASYLRDYFPSVCVSDISKEMLFKCTDPRLEKVCCDMRNLPFKVKYDLIYSTFDSVNYLLTQKDLKKMFEGICAICNEGTVFTFDASLEKNSRRYEKHLNRQGRYKGMTYVQKSRYDAADKMHYNHFEIIMPDGKIVNETHIQKIHKFETYFDIIDKAGLYVVDCFDAFSFDKASDKSLRAQFVTKKKR
jgi:ubiquinone/menaquinone biosynthesis C-methylase UbiE